MRRVFKISACTIIAAMLTAGAIVSFPAGNVFAEGSDSIPIDEEHFPDENLRTYISENYDTDDEKGYLSSDERNAVNLINVSEVTSVEGLEYFPNLQSLALRKSTITSLDCSGNSQLQVLNVENGVLAKIDTSKCTDLTYLNISHNHPSDNSVIEFDISNNYELKTFFCEDIGISNLDVTNNKELVMLACGKNNLTELNVSNNTKLQHLLCDHNYLKGIDVSTLASLKTLYIEINELESLDVSNNPDLASLNCHFNDIRGLDITNNPYLISV